MIEITPVVFFTVFGTYTMLLVGCMMWLNGKFNTIGNDVRDRVSMTAYDQKHADLETRVRNLEIQVAARQWPGKS